MKVGDVVKIVNLDKCDNLFELEEIVTISYEDKRKSPNPLKYRAYNKKGEEWWLQDINIKKLEINDTEEFFNFLHPNMEITYRKELFDKLYKQFKQDKNENAD